MFVYKKTESSLWTVGHYDRQGKWIPESDHSSDNDAASRCSYLNGGHAAKASLPPLSLREWFAGQALAGYLSSFTGTNPPPSPENAARKAFAYADAMMEQAKKPRAPKQSGEREAD